MLPRSAPNKGSRTYVWRLILQAIPRQSRGNPPLHTLSPSGRRRGRHPCRLSTRIPHGRVAPLRECYPCEPKALPQRVPKDFLVRIFAPAPVVHSTLAS